MYDFFSPDLKSTLYFSPHVHAISPLNAQLIHWLSRRKIFLTQFYTYLESFQILYKDFDQVVFVRFGISSANFPVSFG